MSQYLFAFVNLGNIDWKKENAFLLKDHQIVQDHQIVKTLSFHTGAMFAQLPIPE